MDQPQTANEPAQAAATRHSFRFTIRGLFVCVFGIAFGLAESRRANGSVGEGLLAALSAWAALGLGRQARDLYRHFHDRHDLTREQRWGARFAIGWRSGAILLWTTYYVMRQCQDAGLLSLPEQTNWAVWFDVGRELRLALLGLLLLIAAGPRFSVVAGRSSLWSKTISGLAIVAGALLALVFYWDQMAITFLIHVVCELKDSGCFWPYRFAHLPAVPTLTQRYQPFIRGAAAAVFLGLFNCGVLWRLAVQWSRLRWLKAAVLATGIALLCALEQWLATSALSRASPYMAANVRLASAYDYLLAVAVIGVAVTVAAYRCCARPWDTAGDVNTAWRANREYPHERAYWMALLAAAMVGAVIQDEIVPHGWARWADTLYYLVLEGNGSGPRNLLWLAMFLFALGRLAQSLWGRPRAASGIAALDPLQCAVIWCATFALAPLLVIAIASFSFALWLTPLVF
ncbi:MAG TPA: hypothetical protein VF278_20415 [Pirellulales bacterium]